MGASGKRGVFAESALGLWLSWRELSGRRAVFAFNVVIIAFLVALPVTFDFMGKARRESVEARLDYMGPSLSLVPGGVSSQDLATGQLRGRTIPAAVADDVRFDFPGLLKGVETRLVLRVRVEGGGIPAMGMDFRDALSYPFSRYSPGEGEVLLGGVAAKKLGRKPGDAVRVESAEFVVAGVIETTGAIEDASVFLSLSALQELTGHAGRINEVRLFPRSSEALAELDESLGKRYPHLDVVDSYRGDVVEKDIGATLQSYQKAVFAAAFALIALCIMISTYINLEGRKAEISTVCTLGARQGFVFRILAFRTVWLALLGAAAGHALGVLAMMFQDAQTSVLGLWSWASFVSVVAGTVVLGLMVTVPFALYSVYRRDLLIHL